jgi:hypothetical protein
MSDLEDLSAKAARLWLEFMQAQAKAAASAAARLPEVTRSLAEAGVPLAAEVNRWIEGAHPAVAEAAEAHLRETSPQEQELPAATLASTAPERKTGPTPLTRIPHRRLKTPKSMSRRRAPRA